MEDYNLSGEESENEMLEEESESLENERCIAYNNACHHMTSVFNLLVAYAEAVKNREEQFYKTHPNPTPLQRSIYGETLNFLLDRIEYKRDMKHHYSQLYDATVDVLISNLKWWRHPPQEDAWNDIIETCKMSIYSKSLEQMRDDINGLAGQILDYTKIILERQAVEYVMLKNDEEKTEEMKTQMMNGGCNLFDDIVSSHRNSLKEKQAQVITHNIMMCKLKIQFSFYSPN